MFNFETIAFFCFFQDDFSKYILASEWILVYFIKKFTKMSGFLELKEILDIIYLLFM
jgi:hypothetical protein